MTKKTETISLISENTYIPKPRLKKLKIKNFRSIGKIPIEIDLDEIVVLVGANNAGKSSILRAYEVAMNNGSKEGYLTIDDFPNQKIDDNNLPEIELETIISENRPGEQWIKQLENGEMLIRERWIWHEVGKPPKRQGFDVLKNDWSDKVPWGAPNVANAYRPKPHRIDAFSSPGEQEKAIASLLTDIINGRIKTIKSSSCDPEKTDYEILLESIGNFQMKVMESMKGEIQDIENSISEYLGKVFTNYVIKLDANPETNIEKTYSPFKETPSILMGAKDGYMSSVEAQGSGARRTLMWTALKYLKERADQISDRPHVLLLDEPEVCLHPRAIREARNVLYELAKGEKWQVMITTHSPIFIDLSYDNTTIIRVEKNEKEEVTSTTLYRPERAKLSDEDKENLKLLNVCDPYVQEFFFGGRIVVVEGDTEYTVFSYLKLLHPEEYDDVHIIRARGKGIIPSICKILNQFSCNYAILHDSDTEKASNGNANPAWALNNRIIEEANKAVGETNVVACITDFETALSGKKVYSDKPYDSLQKMKENSDFMEKVKKLFDGLLDSSKELPDNCKRWRKIEDLKK